MFRHIRLWLLGNSGGITLIRPVGGIEIAELIPKMPMSDVQNWLRKQILISSPLSCVQGYSILHKLSFKVWFFSSYTEIVICWYLFKLVMRDVLRKTDSFALRDRFIANRNVSMSFAVIAISIGLNISDSIGLSDPILAS